ncbi:MAG: ABC transporter ATP-binding protein [Candidatus Bathyarchaeia archaeon]
MLNAEKLNVFYGLAQALWDVSIRVDEGEIVSIVGSNGAGKSTTLKTIAGLLRPRSGHIKFNGVDLLKTPPHKIVENGIALVPEGRWLFPLMTVQENLELGAYTKEARRDLKNRLDEVFNIFPILSERRKQLAGTLSGGEQQMLAIARALMSRPKLLMLDEPSLGLAPSIVRRVFEIIERINENGVAILLVEQNIHHALNISDRGYVLENGRVVLSGRSDELLENAHVKKAYLGI